MIEPSIHKLLVESQPVAALIADRVYLGSDQQDERRPRVVVTLTDRQNDDCFDGPTNVVTGTVQIACLAPTYEQAKQVTEVVRTKLHCYSGFGVSSYIEIDFIKCGSESDIPATPLEGQAKPTFGVAIDATFMFRDDR